MEMESSIDKLFQKSQDRICFIGSIYGCSFRDGEMQHNKMSGPKEDLELLHQYITEEQILGIAERIRKSDIEEILVEDTEYPWLKLAAIDGKGLPEVHNSLVRVFAVVFDTEEAKAPEGLTYRTDEEHFYKYMELILQVDKMIQGHEYSKVEAEAMSLKSQMSVLEMEQSVRRLAAISETVQLLEIDASVEKIIDTFLRITGEYLGLTETRVYQVETDNGNLVDIVGEWFKHARQVSEEYAPPGEGLKEVLLGLKNKPLVISTGTSANEKLRTEMQERNIKAIVGLPIIISDMPDKYVLFEEKERDRSWTVEDIKFMNDTVKILQSVIVRRNQKTSLANSHAMMEAVLDNVGCGVYVCEKTTGTLLFTNKYLKNSFPKEHAAGVLDYIFGEKKDIKKKAGSYELYYGQRESWYDFYYTSLSWIDGREAYLCSVYDITDKKNYQKRIEQQAYTDFLTGLCNRMCCERDLAHILDEAKLYDNKGVLLYLDLDDFKHINDGLGHQYGDVLLREIAQSMRHIDGIKDTCYRMGGDEFVIIIPPEAYSKKDSIIDQIKLIFSKPWFLNGADYYCTMSMGIVSFPAENDDVQDLIKKADESMYEAKKSGKNRSAEYSEKTANNSIKRLDMEKHMRDAVSKGCDEFEVYFQPIVDVIVADTPICTGAEALVRWNSKALGFVSPGEFIPLSEYLGLITPIGNHVLIKACEACKGWNDSGYPDYKVNVNLSVVQLLQPDIVETIEAALLKTGLNPHNLTLEVTESLAINDMKRMQKILNNIKALGVRIALDDFGTGYSSLSHIREMPLDLIKVDRSFILDLATDSYARAFLKMIADLADAIHANVCVEGIEEEQQYKILQDMKVEMIQGYYFDRPMKQSDFESKYVLHKLTN